jgi:hypothetical protein
MVFVRPSGEVAEVADDQRHSHVPRNRQGHAVIESFQGCKLVGILFDKIREAIQEPSALRCAGLSPWAAFKGVSSHSDCLVDVCGIRF